MTPAGHFAPRETQYTTLAARCAGQGFVFRPGEQMKVLFQCLAIGCGGFFGSLARWGVAQLFGRLFATQFPLGTFVINITGSLFLGWFLTFIAGRYPVSDTMRLAVATGFVGAYTTFSTFMYESTVLSDDGARLQAIANLIGSLIVGLAAVKLGMIIARRA